jgi:hypothetical protein
VGALAKTRAGLFTHVTNTCMGLNMRIESRRIHTEKLQRFCMAGGGPRAGAGDPRTYLQVVAKIIPAELHAKHSGDVSLTVVSGIDSPPGSKHGD